MKQYLYLFAILALAGCTLEEQAEKGMVPITLTATVGDGIETRADTTVNNAFATGDVFYAYFPEDVKVGSATWDCGTTFSYDGTEWNAATPPYFNTGVTSATVHAYYPSTVTNSTSSFSVQQNQLSNANYKSGDLMYATTTVNAASPTGNLLFHHKMAKLKVVVQGNGFENLNVTGITVKNMDRTVAFTPSTGALGATSNSGDISIANNGACLFPPQTRAAGDFLVVSTSEGDATFALGEAKTFAAGASYTVVLSVSEENISQTATITDWLADGTLYLSTGGGNSGDFTIGDIANQTWDGTAKEPSFTVSMNGTPVSSSNYDFFYYNNVNPGMGVVMVVGKGAGYTGKCAMKVFTINKAGASIGFAETSVSKYAYNYPYTFTYQPTNSGDGTVSGYSSSNTSVATVDASTGVVTVNGVGSTTITATVADGANYAYAIHSASYTLNVTAFNFEATMNPLWYVAEKYCGQGLTFAEDDKAGYYYTWPDAMSNYGAQTTSYNGWYAGNKTIQNADGTTADGTWHLPTQCEGLSIIPAFGPTINSNFNLWNDSGGYKTDGYGYTTGVNYVCFGYNDETKAGIADHRYWVQESATVRYAIRFIGTDYCSVWKYESLSDNGGAWSSSNIGYMQISATLIGNVVTDSSDGAAAWWSEYGADVPFGNTANGIQQQRVFYASGVRTSSPVTGPTANTGIGGSVNFYLSTTTGDNNASYVYMSYIALKITSHDKTAYGCPVRLFRDN